MQSKLTKKEGQKGQSTKWQTQFSGCHYWDWIDEKMCQISQVFEWKCCGIQRVDWNDGHAKTVEVSKAAEEKCK